MKKIGITSVLCLALLTACEQQAIQNEAINEHDLQVLTDSHVTKLNSSSQRIGFDSKSPDSHLNDLLERFSMALARSLKKGDVRNFLKNEAEKQFDDDYDILYAHQGQSNVGGKEFQDILAETGLISKGELIELEKLYPKLNIALPIHIEKWRTVDQVPVVAFLPTTYVENKTENLVGYDHLGGRYSINAIKEPSVPVVIVGENERVDDSNNVREGFKKRPAVLGDVIYNSSSARAMACVSPYRTNERWERFHQVRMNVPAFEGWAKGKAELRIKCFAPNLQNPNSTSFTENIYESSDINIYRDQSNDWINREFALFFWNNSLRTQSVYFTFMNGMVTVARLKFL